MKTSTDQNGQPLNAAFNAHRRMERDISEMLGLAKGILADGRVDEREVKHVRNWMSSHPDLVETWPGDIICERLERIFADGVITLEEREDLGELLSDLVGGKAGIIVSENAATVLPLDKPAPKVIFDDHVFVFTGKFAFGPRSACQRSTNDAGGLWEDAVTQRTRYLVIGTFGSRDWVHTSHGRKIEKAVHYKTNGQKLFIIAEDHWAASLPSSHKTDGSS
jgi:NAD-dependent DNA ligase